MESIITKFHFNKDETILSVFKLSDRKGILDNKRKGEENEELLLKHEKGLKYHALRIDTCVVVTNKGVYKVLLR